MLIIGVQSFISVGYFRFRIWTELQDNVVSWMHRTTRANFGVNKPQYEPCNVCFRAAEEDNLFDVTARMERTVKNRAHVLLDFSCDSVFAPAFWHRLMDCSFPAVSLLGTAIKLSSGRRNISYFAPPYMREIMSLMIEGLSLKVKMTRLQTRSVQSKNVIVFNYTSRSFGRSREYLPCRECLVSTLFKVVQNSRRRSNRQSILLISRKRNRKILDEDVLLRMLKTVATKKKLSQQTYHGNESLAETIRMFSAAVVIIGYHGAGFVNTIFAQNTTFVIEISTFLHPQIYSWKKWRSNRWGSPRLKWRVLYVEHHHLRPLPMQNHSNGTRYDWDHYIKPRNCELGREHIDRIVEEINMHLDSVQSELSRRP